MDEPLESPAPPPTKHLRTSQDKLQKQREKAQQQQEKQLKCSRRGASAASGGAPSKHRRLVETSTPGGEGDAHMSDGLGCAAAPQLQPSRTAAKQDGKQADDLAFKKTFIISYCLWDLLALCFVRRGGLHNRSVRVGM